MKEQFQLLTIDKGTQLLPIGTIIRLESVEPLVMIYGRKQNQVDGEDTLWDYVACPYPQGHISNNTNVFFQHEYITEVVFKGLETEGEVAFRKELDRQLSTENEKMSGVQM